MTDEKDNVILGPWGNEKVENNGEWIKKKYDKALDKNNSQLEVQSKLLRIDSITENVLVQLIHTLSENGYDISDENFILDIGFISEAVKGAISRQEKLPHIIQGLIDNIMAPDKTKSEDGIDLHYSRFDAPLLAELVEMAEEIKEDGTEISVEFEADTDLESDPEKIINWNDEKKDKGSKGSLHDIRSEKIHGKKDDEDKDKD
tara:strand:+ start:57 stop:665 length:609 start_codon:yes stop_codon:yes gene_type:complete